MHYYTQQAIIHINNCIQANLSLPINEKDCLSTTLIYAPNFFKIEPGLSAEMICHKASKQNLDIALSCLLKFIKLGGQEPDRATLIVQIQDYMEILVFLDRKLSIFIEPFYNRYQELYREIIEETYDIIERYLNRCIEDLNQLPANISITSNFKGRSKKVVPETILPQLRRL